MHSLEFSQVISKSQVRDMPLAVPSEGDGDLAKFNADVEEIGTQILILRRSVDLLRALHQQRMTLVKAAEVKKMNVRITNSIAETSTLAKDVKGSIEALKKSNAASCRKPGCGKGSAAERHRSAVTQSLVPKFKSVLEEFQKIRSGMQEDERNSVARRLAILTGKQPDPEELDAVLNAGGKSEDILRMAVERQGLEVDAQSMRDSILEIEERSSAVAGITRGLQELSQLMMDMALMVEAQQEQLDEIELDIEEACKATKAGTGQLKQAWTIHKNTQKWVIFGSVAGVVVVLIIVLWILKATGAI